jgi:60 kDa SS-A/Ro ribonucleoprotein
MGNSTLRTVGAPVQKTTPGTKKAAPEQKKNAAGGYVFKVGKMEAIKRFLILGAESGFYQTGQKLTLKRVSDIEDVARTDKVFELIDLIVSVSVEGRAPKQDPAIFALALVIATTEDDAARSYAYQQVDKVCRTGTTLFMFAEFLKNLRGGKGFGMGARKAFKRWYEGKDIERLGYQLTKYKNREGWSHADLIKLARPTKSSEDELFRHLMDYTLGRVEDPSRVLLPKAVTGNLKALEWENTPSAKVSELISIIKTYGLSWEMLPSSALNNEAVWTALLENNNVPLGALLRQLSRLTRIGVIVPLGGKTQLVVDRLTDRDALAKARLHPMTILLAQKAYALGHSTQARSTATWVPNQRIIAALDEAFHLAFKFAEPTGLRYLVGVDTSGSMGARIADVPNMTASEGGAAMACVIANIEPEVHTIGFDAYTYPLSIRKGMTLQEATWEARAHTGRMTDVSCVIRYAREQKIQVDVFVLMTDNETYAGPAHTHEELAKYRKETGIDAKLVVVATNASRSSVADPKDPRTLDVVGFDSSVPQVISAFAKM